jgi:hypothetical protein
MKDVPLKKKISMKPFILIMLLLGVVIMCIFFYSHLLFSANEKDINLIRNENKTILFIPLDDRPVNNYVPDKISKIADLDILMPPKNLLGHFEEPGDSDQIMSWLTKNAATADTIVISADMLAYGGLVGSRTPNVLEEKAIEIFNHLKVLKEQYPEKEIYVYSSLLRLAPTALENSDMEVYSQLRQWSTLQREYETDRNADLDIQSRKLEKEIGLEVLNIYKSMRKRNLEVNRHLLTLSKNGVIDYLVFGQDDSSEHGLHRTELNILEDDIESLKLENTMVLSGIDELGTTLISRATTKMMGISPKVHIVYDNHEARSWIPPFENKPLHDNIQKHIQASGATTTTNPFEADYHFFVKSPFFSFPDLFVQKIKDYTNEGYLVSVTDTAKVNQSDAIFVEELLKKIDIDKLISYSGWNTAGNSVGLSLSMANIRFVSLTLDAPIDKLEEKTKHHIELLYRSFIIDYGYKTMAYPKLKKEAELKKDDPLSLGVETSHYEKMANLLLEETAKETLNQAFIGKKFYIKEHKKEFISPIKVEHLIASMPWNRFFEIEIEPTISFKKRNNEYD